MSRKKNPTFQDAMLELGIPYEAKHPGNIVGSLIAVDGNTSIVVAVTRIVEGSKEFSMPRYFFGFHGKVEAFSVAETLKRKRALVAVYVINGVEAL